jgi:capsular exopolysaccharide synthesis family protein
LPELPEQKDDISISNLLQAQRELLMGSAQPTPPQSVAVQSPPDTPDDAFVNIKHYAFLVYGRKWWVLLVTMLVVGAACFYGYRKEKAFEASARVRLSSGLGGAGSVLGGRRTYFDPESLAQLAEHKKVGRMVNTEFIAVLEKKKLDLKGDVLAEIDREIANAQKREQAELKEAGEGGFKSGIGRVKVGKHGISLTARHVADGSEQAAKLITRAKAMARAQAIAKLFREQVSGDEIINLLDRLVKTNEDEFGVVASKIAKGFQQNPERVLSRTLRPYLDRLNAAQQALARTKILIAEKLGRKKSLEAQQRDPVKKITRSASPELRGRMLSLRTQLAQMKARYKPGHPKYVAKVKEIEALDEYMKSQPSTQETILDSGQGILGAEIDKTKAHIAELNIRLDAQKKNLADVKDSLRQQGLSKEDLEYATLVREQRALEQMGVELQHKLRQARLIREERRAKVRDPENGLVAVKGPSPAKLVGAGLTQTVGFAAILGLVMGVLLALLLEHLDDTVRNEISARRVTNLPVIAKLPRFEGSDDRRFISPSAPRSDVAETFKFFHNHVRYAGPNAPEKCLQVTSPGPEEGKSYVAMNLALSFASEGNRVCFVDADLRRSRTHERLDVLRPRGHAEHGLCAYLEGSLSYEEAVRESEIENLSLLLAGGRASNPPRMLRSDRMHELLERLKTEFDVVIIDSPPVLPVVDSAIISSMAQATLLVVRFAITHQGDLAESAGRLAHVNAPLVGVVINAVHGAAAGYYYGRYRYRYRYGSGYGYGS